MKASDKPKFGELLVGVYALYRVNLSEPVLEIWWRACANLELDAVAEALGQHCVNPDSGQYIPKPADVVKMLGGTTKDAAIIAWAKLDKAVRHIGSWATVVFDDPLIHVCVENLGGWLWLCMQTVDEWRFIERRFCDHYRAYKARGETPAYPPKLFGSNDQHNLPNGFPAMQPAMVGDPQVCARVMAGGAAMAPHARIGKLVALPERVA